MAKNHVQIHYKDVCIYCDQVEYNQDTQDILLLGNIFLYSPDGLTTGQRLLYNIQSKQIRALNIAAARYPMLWRAFNLHALSSQEYHAQYASFTTDDQLHPGYHIEAKAVHVYKNKNGRIAFLYPTFYAGKVPIFWLPYLRVRLNNTGVKVLPGYDSFYGAFLLAAYSFTYWWLDTRQVGTMHVDYRTRHGSAFGLDTTIRGKNKSNRGSLTSYWAYYGNKPFTRSKNLASGIPPHYHRYRITYNQRLDCSDSIYTSCNLNWLSDCNVMQDFYTAESRKNPKLDNNISLTKRGPNYTLNLLYRFQVNNFQNVVKRLPELAWEIKQHPLFGGGPFYLDGTWTLGKLEKSFGSRLQPGSINEDILQKEHLYLAIKPTYYSALRFGSFTQISMPKTYFRWITIVPHVGFRITLYKHSGEYNKSLFMHSDSLGTQKKAFINNAIAEDAPTLTAKRNDDEKERAKFQQLMGSRSMTLHPSINFGLESSFKVSRAYHLQSRFLGVDGLMHVIQPYINYSVVQRLGRKPRRIFQFDTIQQTTQPLPINFPDFQATDAVDSWSIVRTGIRHNCITRRDGGNHRWFSIDTFFDYNLSNPYTFSKIGNLRNLLTYYPSPWLTISCDLQAPLDREGFTQFDLSFSLMPISNLKFSVGYCYLTKYPIYNLLGVRNTLYNDVNQVVFDGHYRLNDNWAISSRGQYDANQKLFLYQRYLVHRDLSSWTASFGMDIRRNQGQKLQTGFMLVMTLKAAPQVTVPLWNSLRRPLWPDEKL